ncbi:AtpZ/AtpI family protein [Qipengyuania gaetbuli]|uniref:ATP synthase protein I n=1 Tax=Qipengyuania gaetbuli TaxID=266952 RepID=A0A844XYI4_9SPHN|nr:AtpZ/AtpI family protein [Qipengyuania gaetbuli]MBY6013967.1 AtpZ/AtpI family protein [Qipengyuania gaetbuli]MCA0911152.1 AtpZ/AtpI family protein [Qipengyuania gaetbuli]MXO50257.1 ATP-binding protein [Qipengyuania gaetbuli]
MSDDKPAREPIEEDARIDALEKRLAAAQQREEERNRPQVSGSDANYRSGNRVLADLLGGLLGGSVIGYAIGYFTGTNPWGLLVGLFLGIVVAFRNIIRAANQRPEE